MCPWNQPRFTVPAARLAALAILIFAPLALTGCTSMPARGQVRPPDPEIIHDTSSLHVPAPAAAPPAGSAGMHLYSTGTDGLLLRLELIRKAQRSLDLQYYIFHGDESGRLITEALLAAAQRGVRIRILVDDGESRVGDEQVFALAGSPRVAIRVFNPWRYRGHSIVLRGAEFLVSKRRLDHRMHDKLLIADDSIALIGGRNIGDQYFQVDPDSQYADDDLAVTGATTHALSAVFEEFWTSEAAVPVEAILPARQRDARALEALAQRHTVPERAVSADATFSDKLAAGQPLADLLSGAAPLVWASADLAYDPPEKGSPQGSAVSGLMFAPVAHALRDTSTQFTMVTPYLIPTPEELRLLQQLSGGGRRVRILTTSLEACTDPPAQAGYMHFRVPLLKAGIDLYELRRQPERSRGTGQSAHLLRQGNFGLHAKLLIFDEQALYVGSMNFDARSRRINTEIGLIVHSPELAGQAHRRFEAMIQPSNAFHVTLADNASGSSTSLRWSTQTGEGPVEYTREPARSFWQRLTVKTLTLLPIDDEL
ncbi:MAG: phospholipase D family protein [Proteobacteria bacterium]|nr:phospholipase D family protein [Pseudomonadota bacterium]